MSQIFILNIPSGVDPESDRERASAEEERDAGGELTQENRQLHRQREGNTCSGFIPFELYHCDQCTHLAIRQKHSDQDYGGGPYSSLFHM